MKIFFNGGYRIQLRVLLGLQVMLFAGMTFAAAEDNSFSSSEASSFYRRLLKGQESTERTYVDMNDQQMISFSPGQGEKIIYTTALAGCNALAYIVRLESGAMRVAMSHFWRLARQAQVNRLRYVKNDLEALEDPVVRKKLVVMVPRWRFVDGAWQPNEDNQMLIASLEDISGVKAERVIYNPEKEEFSCGAPIGTDDYFAEKAAYNTLYPCLQVRLNSHGVEWASKADNRLPHRVE